MTCYVTFFACSRPVLVITGLSVICSLRTLQLPSSDKKSAAGAFQQGMYCIVCSLYLFLSDSVNITIGSETSEAIAFSEVYKTIRYNLIHRFKVFHVIAVRVSPSQNIARRPFDNKCPVLSRSTLEIF